MNIFETFMDSIYSVIKTFSFFDLIDIIIVSYVIFKTIKIVRETRAGQLVKGIILLLLFYFISIQFGLKTMSFLLKNVFQIGIIALIVLFQPELRRALEKVGRSKMVDLSVFSNDDSQKKAAIWENSIDTLCESVFELAKNKTGALIVIERKTRLGEQIDTGIKLNAIISRELLGNIFFMNTPLHDGALIIREGRLLAAACFLPKPQKEDHIESKLGSRHRAAIGISEISDSITIIVSEETGSISIAEDGNLIRSFTKESLYKFLINKVISEKKDDQALLKRTKIWGSKKK